MRQLQLKYRVYALDLFGYGDSGKNPQKYALKSQVRLLDEFMEQLGIPKVAVLAHGYGAQVAIEFARQYPDRVARMLLVSVPLFDPGDLENRIPPGKQVYLTNATAAPVVNTAVEKTIPAGMDNRRKKEADLQVIADDDKTLPSALRETLRNPSTIDRDALRRAAAFLAEQRKAAENQPASISIPAPTLPQPAPEDAPTPKSNGHNPLKAVLSNDMEALLGNCFKKSDPEYEKLQQDVAKSDSKVLEYAAQDFDAGYTLDTLRGLAMPVVVLHGDQDPVIPSPQEAIWNYITEDKEDKLLPVPLAGVRHFPMLEHDTFQRLVGMFLELPDISKIELKERWRRRSR